MFLDVFIQFTSNSICSFISVVMKDHTSHDVLLLCSRCHQLSNMHDLRLRLKLAAQCDAPLASKTVEVPRLR